MLKSFQLLPVFLICSVLCFSQQSIVDRGLIVFERKVNTYAVLPDFLKGSELVSPDALPTYLQRYRQDHPQFWVDSFQLIFINDSTLYQPIGNISPFLHGTGVPMADKNRVFSSLSTNQFFAEKNAYNESRIIQDSLVKIRWKLTDETRDIGGFECRRANGLVYDSIYIVAFYTDAIMTKGGPEGFHGLPGMILGLALPHYHITYFATRIDPKFHFDNSIYSSFANQPKGIKQVDFFSEMINYLKERKLDNEWMKVFLRL